MKVLIIGGSGVLSSAVVNNCLAKGYSVTMINRGNNKLYTNSNAELIVCDVNNVNLVQTKLSGLHFDVVIDFIVYRLDQLKHSLSLFGHVADQYIFISSAQVYNTSINKTFEETDPTPQQIWQYSVNKDICEKFLIQYSQEKGINYTIIRPGVNYDNRRIPYGMYPPIGMHWTIVERMKIGKPIITWNGGQNKLNLTRVEDFAEGVVGLLGKAQAYNRTFNVAGDFVYTWMDVLVTLGRILDVEVKTIDLPLNFYANELHGEEREMLLGGRACNLVLSNKRLKDVVPEYQSRIKLEEGLRMTLDWYQTNKYYHGIDYKWDAEQDRIISKFTSGKYVGRYYNYLSSNWLLSFANKLIYKIEYSEGRKYTQLYWKSVRKFIYKPIVKLLSK